MIEDLGWPDLQDRRKSCRLAHFQKMLGSDSAPKITEFVNTRAHGRFFVPYGRVNIHKYSYFARIIRNYPELELNVYA